MDTLAPDDLLHYVRIVRELKELAGENDPWIPLWSTIAGALLAYIPLGFGGWWRSKKASQSVQAALIAEISYMVGIIELRGYLNDFIKIHAGLDELNARDYRFHQEHGTHFSEHSETISIIIPDDYNKIYGLAPIKPDTCTPLN